jgi:beta-lactamase regulating signal transducer with metallopeptidase domain
MSGILELALRNLAAWSLQVGVVALVAAALSRLVPVERPAARLAFWQALLVAVLALPLVQPWHASVSSVSWSMAPSDSVAASSPGPAALARPAPSLPAVALALLVAGVTLRAGRLGAGLARLRSLRRKARPLAPPPWLRSLRDELAPRARFAVSDDAGTPATFGLRRPVVLLPPSFESMERERQEAIALHELVHARRAHWLALVLEDALKAALFFHPAVHWLVGQVRLAREQTVDDAVVRRLGRREAYLDSLVAVARLAVHARAVPAAPFLRESHLRERVDLLLKEVLMSRTRTVAHVGLAAATILLAVSWTASAVPLQSAKPAPEGKVAISDDVTAPAPPKLVRQAKPVYPADAKTEGVEGAFVIDLVIGKDGTIQDAKLAASAPTIERLEQLKTKDGKFVGIEGDKRLAEAALAAVKQWQYEPILKDGKPVDFKATVTVRFKLS